MTAEGRAFIADVGTAKMFDTVTNAQRIQSITTMAGTSCWMAPEMLTVMEQPKASRMDMTKLDIFSLGLISFFILDTENFRKEKFLNKSEKELERYIQTFREKNLVPLNFYKTLELMVSYLPEKRPSVEYILSFVNSMKEVNILIILIFIK